MISGVEEFEMFEEFKKFEMFQGSRVQVLRVQGFKCCAFKGSSAARSRVQEFKCCAFKGSRVSEFQSFKYKQTIEFQLFLSVSSCSQCLRG